MATAAGAYPRLRAERIFFTGMAILVLVCAFVGFAPSYYLRGVVPAPHPYEPLTPLVHLHGLTFSAWVLLFMAQTALVAAGRVDLHRRLGLLGFGLIALMIPLALMAGIYGIGRPLTAPPGIDPLSWSALPLLDVPVFGTLIVLALVNRRRPATHKRLMLIAMINMLDPMLGRAFAMAGLPSLAVTAVIFGFLGLLMLWDWRTQSRVLLPTLAGSALVATRIIVTPLIWATPAWMGFAAALYRAAT